MLCQGKNKSSFSVYASWYLDGQQKSGDKRRDLEVSSCFAPLLRWVVRLWKSETKQVALFLDATTAWEALDDSGHQCGGEGLCDSRGMARSYQATGRLLASALGRTAQLHPGGDTARVACDRCWLIGGCTLAGCGMASGRARGIRFCRLNMGIKARLVGESTFEWISRWVPTPGTSWQGEVECFAGKNSRVKGTLLMHWEAGYESAWVILTDLKPEEALISWYGFRTWHCRAGSKILKPGTVGMAP